MLFAHIIICFVFLSGNLNIVPKVHYKTTDQTKNYHIIVNIVWLK